METINQMANTAAKAVWGDSTTAHGRQEPISGATGDVSKGEPYDAGNMDYDSQNRFQADLEDGNNYTTNKKSDSTPDAANDHENERQDYPTTKAPGASEQKGSEEPADVNPEEGVNPDDLTGTGPRPLETLAKEHGGNAAACTEEGKASSSPKQENEEERELNESNKQSGEEYVKATGFAADGGDFDASMPGAGREADRLLEQKGVHKGDGDAGDDSHGIHGSSNHGKGKDKPSLGERIKNKLHKH